ncbi:hypothetical protein PIB30_085967, partial [Stylosanthes scabra]|nr:hypothetical protein [Stylosanthes scabra]
SPTATYRSSRTSTITDPVINLNCTGEDAHIGTVSEVSPEGNTPHVIGIGGLPNFPMHIPQLKYYNTIHEESIY